MNKQLESQLVSDDVKTSDVLSVTLSTLPNGSISLGDLIERLDRRSYSSVFLLLAMLCLLPGVSIIAGFVMLFPAAQMAFGFRAPKFPRIIREYQIAVRPLQKWGLRTVPFIIKLEQFIKPRFSLFANSLAQRMLGVFVLILSLVVAIPFPLSNYLPAIAVICLSLGLLERDGLMILVGIAIGIAATAFGVSVFYLLLAWLF